MNKSKIIFAVIGGIVLSILTIFVDTQKDTAETLLRGLIDNTIKGQINADYLKTCGWEGDAEAIIQRETTQLTMIKYLQTLYGYETDVENLSFAITSSFEEVYRDILKEFQYTIKDIEKVDEGEYIATIAFKPFALGDTLDEVAYEFYAKAEEDRLSGNDTPIDVLDSELFGLLLEETNKFAKDIKYGEEEVVYVTLKESNRIWTPSDSYAEEFIVGIMDLNLEERQKLSGLMVNEAKQSNLDENIDSNIDETMDSETNEEE